MVSLNTTILHHGNSRVRKPLRTWSYELRHTDDVLHTEMDQKLHRTCWSTPSITLEERIDTQASDTDVSRSLGQNSQMLEATPKPSHCRMDSTHLHMDSYSAHTTTSYQQDNTGSEESRHKVTHSAGLPIPLEMASWPVLMMAAKV